MSERRSVESLVVEGEVSAVEIVAFGREGWMFVRYDEGEGVSVFQRAEPGLLDSVISEVGPSVEAALSVAKTIGLTGGCLTLGLLSSLINAANDTVSEVMEAHLNRLAEEGGWDFSIEDGEVVYSEEEIERSIERLREAEEFVEGVMEEAKRPGGFLDELSEAFHEGADEVAEELRQKRGSSTNASEMEDEVEDEEL